MTAKTHSTATPGIPLAVQLCFAGSRHLFQADAHPGLNENDFTAKVQAKLKEIVERLPADLGLSRRHFLCGISQFAVGADTVFTKVCKELNVLQRIFLPQHCDEYLSAVGSDGTPDFDHDQQKTTRQLLESPHVIQEHVVATSAVRRVRFQEVNLELARVADVMVCLFAEVGGKGLGGSEDFAEQARTRKRPLLEIRLGVGKDNQPVLTETWHRKEKFQPPQMPEELSELQTKLQGIPRLVDYCIALKDFASHHAQGMRILFEKAAIVTVGTHFFATVFAVVALWWQYPQLLVAELLLIMAGLGMHIYVHWKRVSEQWGMARLAAEVGRSAEPLMGVKVYLSYLFTLPLPQSMRSLLHTVNVLHLRETHRLTEDNFEQRRAQYVRQRVVGQMKYYRDHEAPARARLKLLNWTFLVGSFAAWVSTFIKLLVELIRPEASDPGEVRLKAVLGSLAIVLPVLAVAALSLAAARDLEARVHTYREMRKSLFDHKRRLKKAKTDHAFAALAIETETSLLGENTTWYSRRAFIGIS